MQPGTPEWLIMEEHWLDFLNEEVWQAGWWSANDPQSFVRIALTI